MAPPIGHTHPAHQYLLEPSSGQETVACQVWALSVQSFTLVNTLPCWSQTTLRAGCRAGSGSGSSLLTKPGSGSSLWKKTRLRLQLKKKKQLRLQLQKIASAPAQAWKKIQLLLQLEEKTQLRLQLEEKTRLQLQLENNGTTRVLAPAWKKLAPA